VAVALLPAALISAERRGGKPAPGEYNPDHKTVEMFSAIESGDLEVKFIPRDSTQARILIRNLTEEPLNVELPEVFAGVPVLGQGGFGGGGFGGGGGGNQGVGGGIGGGGIGGGGIGGGQFNVAPERLGEIKVGVVCLEHGKDDPRPKVPYEIRPIAELNGDAKVYELLKAFGGGEINQRAAQAAAWHLANDMSWEELAAKRIEHVNGASEPYFSRQELNQAFHLAASAIRAAHESESKSDGEVSNSTAAAK